MTILVSNFNPIPYLQINNKDLFPLIFLMLIGLFPCLPPSIQSISIVLFLVSSLFVYSNNITLDFKSKVIHYFVLTGFYFFSLLTYFWTVDKVQFRVEIQPNISLLFIPFISIFFLPKLTEKFLHFFLLGIVFSFFIYLILWYNYIVEGVVIFQKYNYGITEFRDKSTLEKFIFLFLEFMTKLKSYSQLGMDGYYYFAPQLHKDFFVHHTYTSALALIAILICLYYFRSSNNYLKAILGILVLIFGLYIIYVDSQVNKFNLILFTISSITWYFYNKWKYSLFIIMTLFIALVFIKKNELKTKLDHVIITSKNKEDLNQGVDFVRYSLYKKAYILFQENKLLGLGLGDYKNELNKNLSISHTQFNSHSQYIYYSLVGGVFNLLLFLVSQIFCLYKIIRFKDVFLFSFFFIFLSNCLFENFLNRLWGVWIYSIFFILFVDKYFKSKNE